MKSINGILFYSVLLDCLYGDMYNTGFHNSSNTFIFRTYSSRSKSTLYGPQKTFLSSIKTKRVGIESAS